MLGGYMGKFLWVDLTQGQWWWETPEEELYQDYLGGYGIGARILYDRMPAGVEPLGPQNILGVLTGPLSGSPAPTGTRWTIVGKSPLTHGWGDANASGFFGAALKRTGLDGIFFVGASAQPVYLLVDGDHIELRQAGELWGKDTYAVEDWVKSVLGNDFEAACIGPAGEKLSLISGVVHAKGRIAARSGLGAVMGSKRLKMIAVRGEKAVPLADQDAAREVKMRVVKGMNDGVGASYFYRTTGTPGYLAYGIKTGDAPTRNWAISSEHFGDPAPLEFGELKKLRNKRKSCWHCPVSCWGTSQTEYAGQTVEAHQPEYETGAAFSSNVMNDNYPAIIKANELCNRYGLDSISAGACVAFAIECFENKLIDENDTGGLVLTWGDHLAMNTLLEQIALREGFGHLLADGVARAAEKVGPMSAPFAIHVGGQELPLHDPRFEPGLGVIYQIDATPGRHTQGTQFTVAPGFPTTRPGYGEQRREQQGRGHYVKEAICLNHVMSTSGLCLFGYASAEIDFIPDMIRAVTGWPFTLETMLETGERIANIRQAFNVREGINPVAYALPARAYGRPPLPDGETAGIEVEAENMLMEYLDDMGWTQEAAIPKPETLRRLGLDGIIKDLWS